MHFSSVTRRFPCSRAFSLLNNIVHCQTCLKLSREGSDIHLLSLTHKEDSVVSALLIISPSHPFRPSTRLGSDYPWFLTTFLAA